MTYEVDFIRKPSITTIRSTIRKALAAEETFILINWGENRILLEYLQYAGGYRSQWVGSGWIGRNGGQDLADDINRAST
jgi:hypothetical protein